LTITPTLEACTARDKLVILRSYNSLSNGASARIPSLMLLGLFMKNTPTGPATPFFEPSPFPLAESDEADLRTPSPKLYSVQRRQSAIDPNLVSVDTLCVCVTLKDWHSPCTSVSFRPQTSYFLLLPSTFRKPTSMQRVLPLAVLL
jgi:hypothetical protein